MSPLTPELAASPGFTLLPMFEEMPPHMVLTPQRHPATPADRAQAQAIVSHLRRFLAKYQDYRVALREGAQCHGSKPLQCDLVRRFKNSKDVDHFDFEQPASLLYDTVDRTFRLTGAMYRARLGVLLEELDRRAPLSIARWHLYRDICWGSQGAVIPAAGTAASCAEAGGVFFPVSPLWMLAIYPFESDPEQVWRLPIQQARQDGTRGPADD